MRRKRRAVASLMGTERSLLRVENIPCDVRELNTRQRVLKGRRVNIIHTVRAAKRAVLRFN
jgi:hypothetical protein